MWKIGALDWFGWFRELGGCHPRYTSKAPIQATHELCVWCVCVWGAFLRAPFLLWRTGSHHHRQPLFRRPRPQVNQLLLTHLCFLQGYVLNKRAIHGNLEKGFGQLLGSILECCLLWFSGNSLLEFQLLLPFQRLPRKGYTLNINLAAGFPPIPVRSPGSQRPPPARQAPPVPPEGQCRWLRLKPESPKCVAREHGPKPAVCPSCLILSHSQIWIQHGNEGQDTHDGWMGMDGDEI